MNTSNRLVASWLTSACLTLAAHAAVPATETADLIFTNGDIRTDSGWAHAMAVQKGVILEVGDDAAISRYRTPKTQVIDLKGATVVPGLQDMHVHPMSAGHAQSGCRFAQGSKPEQMIEAVRQCAAGRAKGEWIIGGQWEASVFKDKPMHRSMLDAVSPHNPVALTDISYHGVWANSLALKAAGITAATPNPPGGFIERDASGEPTGVLRESAAGLVRNVIPPFTPEQNVHDLAWSLSTMLAVGITSYTDAGVDGSDMAAYAALADSGRLKQRVRGCMWWRPVSLTGRSSSGNDYIVQRLKYERERFKPECVKMVLDGVPTDARTAAMLEPYAHATAADGPREKGPLLVPPAELNAALIDLDRRGLTVKLHAAGDAAVREALDAIQAAREANGFSGSFHNVSHNSFVNMADIRRARGIGAALEMSPYIWFANPIMPDVFKAIGTERMQRFTPVKDALDAGALVVPGSDWSVVPSVNPWIALETLVTREPPGGGAEPLSPSQRITLEQAFDLFTVNAAKQMGNAGRTGRIARGLLADVLVLDRNPFRIPVTQVHETRVTMTVINGEIVYRASP
jgi:predicted amidohydrolase YtcJ